MTIYCLYCYRLGYVLPFFSCTQVRMSQGLAVEDCWKIGFELSNIKSVPSETIINGAACSFAPEGLFSVLTRYPRLDPLAALTPLPHFLSSVPVT